MANCKKTREDGVSLPETTLEPAPGDFPVGIPE